MNEQERDTRAAAFFLSVTDAEFDGEWSEPIGPTPQDQADDDRDYCEGRNPK